MTPVTLGIFGKFYSVRHALGQYRSAAVTGVYTVSPPPTASNDWIQTTLESSLQATIRQHPGLSYGLAGQPGEDSILGYEPISHIRRDDVMEFIQIDGQQDAEAIMCRNIEAAHSKLWTPLKPAWRMIVLHSEAGTVPPCSRIRVLFIAHHALADGRSNAAFHVSLMEHFANASHVNQPPVWPMIFDNVPPPPPQVEELVKLPATVTETKGIGQEPVWAGTNESLPPIEGFKSRVRLVTIPPDVLAEALQTCKQNKVTLTVYLHGLICASLCRAVEEKWAFRSITPFSIRHLTNTSANAIVDHVSYIASNISRSRLEGIRKSQAHSAEEFAHIINLARDFRVEIENELERFPQDCPLARSAQVKDIWSHCRSQLGKSSQLSYELSNLGVITGVSEGENVLALERLIFTQCGMASGPAIGFGGVSVRGGPLVISITWQGGVVEESLVELIATDLEKRLRRARD